jgi:hypothetical protein
MSRGLGSTTDPGADQPMTPRRRHTKCGTPHQEFWCFPLGTVHVPEAAAIGARWVVHPATRRFSLRSSPGWGGRTAEPGSAVQNPPSDQLARAQLKGTWRTVDRSSVILGISLAVFLIVLLIGSASSALEGMVPSKRAQKRRDRREFDRFIRSRPPL